METVRLGIIGLGNMESAHAGQVGSGQYSVALANFSAAITEGAPLLAPAAESVHSVELANAMILSSFLEKIVGSPARRRRLPSQTRRTHRHVQFKDKETTAMTITPAADSSQSFRR